LRWLGQEIKDNVAQTRNCCGWPSSPHFLVPTINEANEKVLIFKN